MFGQKLRNLRKENNISIEELANMMGKRPATVHRWESNSLHPLPEELEKLANIFNVSLDELKITREEVLKLNDKLKVTRRVRLIVFIVLFLLMFVATLIFYMNMLSVQMGK